MVNYSNSIIYKLCCNDVSITNEYIGSTTNFKQRKSGHKRTCNTPNREGYNYKVYCFIRENGGFENWSMVEIEKYEATDKRHLHARERYWIEQLKSVLNNSIPGRSIKEWRQVNKESIKEYGKQYHLDNKLKKTKYYQDNKEDIKKQHKIYRDKSKEIYYKKFDCSCGGKYIHQNILRHMKTKKHQKYLTTQQGN